MNWIKTISKISVADEVEQKFLIHETKYALLGVTLFIIFIIPWTDKLIGSVFPGARGPMIIGYKVILFIALYYIIQKTIWFQNL